MKNNYEISEVVEVGKAQDVILGDKIPVTPWDGDEDRRFLPMQDDEE